MLLELKPLHTPQTLTWININIFSFPSHASTCSKNPQNMSKYCILKAQFALKIPSCEVKIQSCFVAHWRWSSPVSFQTPAAHHALALQNALYKTLCKMGTSCHFLNKEGLALQLCFSWSMITDIKSPLVQRPNQKQMHDTQGYTGILGSTAPDLQLAQKRKVSE